MQFTTIAIAAFAAVAAAAPAPVPQGGVSAPVQSFTSGVVIDNESLMPDFGVTPNTNPDGTGNCQGATPTPPIPCFCPPNRSDFLNRMQQFINEGSALGAPLSFPTDDSVGSQIARLQAGVVTLQSMNDTTLGVGCPSGASTYTQMIASLSGQAAAGSG